MGNDPPVDGQSYGSSNERATYDALCWRIKEERVFPQQVRHPLAREAARCPFCVTPIFVPRDLLRSREETIGPVDDALRNFLHSVAQHPALVAKLQKQISKERKRDDI